MRKEVNYGWSNISIHVFGVGGTCQKASKIKS